MTVKELEKRVAALEAEIEALKKQPGPEMHYHYYYQYPQYQTYNPYWQWLNGTTFSSSFS